MLIQNISHKQGLNVSQYYIQITHLVQLELSSNA